MQRKYRDAIRSFDCALVLDPDDHYALRKVAECYIKLGERDDAVRCWEMLGEKLMRKGQHRKAIAAYKMVQRLDPDDRLTQSVIEFIQADLASRFAHQRELIDSTTLKKPTIS